MKKKLIGWLIVFTVVMFLLPWFAIMFAKSNAGMAIVLLLFFIINPICSFLAGFFAGKNIKKCGVYPSLPQLCFCLAHGYCLTWEKLHLSFMREFILSLASRQC